MAPRPLFPLTRTVAWSAVLSVDPGATDEELRAAHRNLVRTYHPDRLVSKGLPEEFMKLANDRLAEINSAYEKLTKEKPLSRRRTAPRRSYRVASLGKARWSAQAGRRRTAEFAS